MSCDEGIKFVLKIFKEILEKNFDLERFDVGVVRMDTQKLERFHGEQLKKFVK